jgi:hypothetical protein
MEVAVLVCDANTGAIDTCVPVADRLAVLHTGLQAARAGRARVRPLGRGRIRGLRRGGGIDARLMVVPS